MVLLFVAAGAKGQGYENFIEADLENEYVKNFIDEVTYEPGQESVLSNYFPANRSLRTDHPNPVIVDVPVYKCDTLITVSRDTLLTQTVDTLIQTHTDTLYHVMADGQKHEWVDTLITIRSDTIYTHSTVTTVSISRDTLVTMPRDTLLLCYSTDTSYSSADTLRLVNGEKEKVEIYNLVPQQRYC